MQLMKQIGDMTSDEFSELMKRVMLETFMEINVSTSREPELMNILEASVLLNLAVATLYEKTSSKTIPHYKHGKKIVFKRSELLAWVESRKVDTLQDFNREALNRSINVNSRPRKRDV